MTGKGFCFGCVRMFAAWSWLLAWFLFQNKLGCLGLSLLMFPVIALIGTNMLEVTLMRRNAIAHMYLATGSWLAQLLTRRLLATAWVIIKALIFTIILFLEASHWPKWIWIILFLDIFLLAASNAWFLRLLQHQVKSGQTTTISRRILVTLNTIVLSLLISSIQFFTPQPDYRQYSWQETVTYSAGLSQQGCEVIAPLGRLKSVKDAIGWRLAVQGFSGLQNTTASILGWLVFLLSSSLALWAFSRMMTGTLIRRTEFIQLLPYSHCR